MTNLKLTTFQALLARVNELKADVFTAREPGDDEMRRAQGLLSEVRDLIQEAITKVPVVGDRTADQIKDAAEAAASFAFEGAEEIGSSDVSCAAADACSRLGLEAKDLSTEDFQVIRRAVQTAIREVRL
jgi:hypothetical protein